jgi:hypothetical protein
MIFGPRRKAWAGGDALLLAPEKLRVDSTDVKLKPDLLQQF